MIKYNVYKHNTGDLLMTLHFYDKRIKDIFLKNFRKLKKQIDVVEVLD